MYPAKDTLIEFCQENALVIANTLFQQHKRRLYTWTSPDSQHQNQIDYILCSQSWRSSIQSAKTRPGADCGSDHELLITKFRLKLKKAGKTARPFRYDLNQIPSDYTVEVRNRFQGLDLTDRVPDELTVNSLKPKKGKGKKELLSFSSPVLHDIEDKCLTNTCSACSSKHSFPCSCPTGRGRNLHSLHQTCTHMTFSFFRTAVISEV